ncbi:MAG: SMI1/KNR4 family protein [Bacteroidia bacterium]
MKITLIYLQVIICVINVFAQKPNSNTVQTEMYKTLKEISKKAILLNDFDFSKDQLKTEWLGSAAATEAEILSTEKRLKIKLPNDYIEFIKYSNGFPQTSSISCSFLPIGKIEYLRILDEDLVKLYTSSDILKEIGEALASSILVGGLNEEQQFLLIPPKTSSGKWSYWKFANWDPVETRFSSLLEYFASDLSFLINETKDLKKPKPKFITDYSLRQAVFNLDWEKVYSISQNFINENKYYGYFNGSSDLFALLLIASGKTNRVKDLEKIIQTLK